MIKTTINNLKKNGFNVLFYETKEQAADFILNEISVNTKVGFGGSMSIKTLKISDRVKEKGGIILDHGVNNLTNEEKVEIMRKQQICDIFLCSTNAVTQSGELINVDGNGNRISAMIFGPKKVIVVVGVNKICKDEEEAYKRLEEKSSPMNNKRLNTLNPCTKTGYCVNCDSETRICRVYSIIKKKPMLTDFTILVVNEELGY